MGLVELQGREPVHTPEIPVAGIPTDTVISIVVVVRHPTPMRFHCIEGVFAGTGWDVFVTVADSTETVSGVVSTDPDVEDCAAGGGTSIVGEEPNNGKEQAVRTRKHKASAAIKRILDTIFPPERNSTQLNLLYNKAACLRRM